MMKQEYTLLDKFVRGVWGLFGLMLCVLLFIASSAQPNILVVQQTVEVTSLAVTQVMVTQIVPTVTPVLTPTPSPTPLYTEHLLAYFPFARTSIDESGRGFHGQVDGDVYFANSTAIFQNEGGKIIWNNLPLEQFTVAFAFYFFVPLPDEPGTNLPEFEVYFLGQHRPCETIPAGFQLLYQQELVQQIILRNGEKQAVAPVVYDDGAINDYLTAVFTDKEAKLYIDGELMGIALNPYIPTSAEVVLEQQIMSSDSCTPVFTDKNDRVTIGIEQLIFYDTPLSDEEVKALFEVYSQQLQP